ncbi:MAG: hypothetical protein R3F22_02515 [Lysobacteraceae bacterium]
MNALLMTRLVVALALGPTVSGVWAQDSIETLNEQNAALQTEVYPIPSKHAYKRSDGIGGGGARRLLAGVNDVAIGAYRINVMTDSATQAFTGAELWGAAYDPIRHRLLFNNGSTLMEWPIGGTVNTIGSITDAGSADLSMTGLAFGNGTLYACRNIANEAIYTVDLDTLVATVFIDYDDATFDCGGLAFNPDDQALYMTNDDSDPPGRGLYRMNTDGSGTLITAYPAGQTDIDGLAIGEGRAYLVIDEPGDLFVYDFDLAAYQAPLTSPFSTSEVFSAAAWVTQPDLVCNGATVTFENGIPASFTTRNSGNVFWSTTDELTACDNGGNQTPGSGNAACADSDETNIAGAPYDAELWTNRIDLSSATAATLHFNAAYNDNSNGTGTSNDLFDVDISTDGASSWTNLQRWDEDHWGPGEAASLDLTAFVGQNVVIRYRYTGSSWNWWAQVDDLRLDCEGVPTPGAIFADGFE